MKILVLGGTGAMGAHLVHLLSQAGHQVSVTSRSRSGNVGAVNYIQGNARDAEFLRTLLVTEWDAIVDFMVYSTDDFKSRVRQLLEAARQYVFLSSARVYASSDTPITENSPRLLDASRDESFLATGEYALAKARQEDVLFDSGRKNWTIIRPYITYSESRLQLGVVEKEGWLYRALHERAIVFSGDINERTTTLAYGLDVARGIQSLIGAPEALGEAFHITGTESIRWKDVLAVYLDILERNRGARPRVILQDLHDFCQWHPAKYQVMYDRMYDRVFDNAKIGRFIDLQTFTSPRIGLQQCLGSFLTQPRFLDVNWNSEALKDRAAGERTPVSEIAGLKNKVKYGLRRCGLH